MEDTLKSNQQLMQEMEKTFEQKLKEAKSKETDVKFLFILVNSLTI